MKADKHQAELARGYKDHHRRTSLIRAAQQKTGWSDAEFRRQWLNSGRPRQQYWQWINELITV